MAAVAGQSSRVRARGGPDATGAAYVMPIQRARMISALVRVATEQGVASVTVSSVVERSGVSRRTFYEVFDDCEDCVLTALADALARVRSRVQPAYNAAGSEWRGRIRAGLAELLAFFEERPEIALLLVVQWPACGATALARRRSLLAELAGVLREGGARTGGRAEPPELMAEGVVGGVVSILEGRLSGPAPAGGLSALLNPLMSMIVLPYLGPAAARAELVRPLPAPARSGARDDDDEPLLRDPLMGLDIRLTYRTARVLAAVAQLDGQGLATSNRMIAQAADITDQGQISKLLIRLQKHGLVSNLNPRQGTPHGGPNAWTLTPDGRAVERSLRV